MLTGPFLGMALLGSTGSPQDLFQRTQICSCNHTHQDWIQQSVPFFVKFLFLPQSVKSPQVRMLFFLFIRSTTMCVSWGPGWSSHWTFSHDHDGIRASTHNPVSPAPSSGPGTQQAFHKYHRRHRCLKVGFPAPTPSCTHASASSYVLLKVFQDLATSSCFILTISTAPFTTQSCQTKQTLIKQCSLGSPCL